MSENKNNEFLFLGFSIEFWTIGYGFILTLSGAGVSILSQSVSITSWIPTIIGIPVLICGLMALWFPQKKKLWMHIGVMFGVISLLGGLDLLRAIISNTLLSSNLWVTSSKLLLLTGGSLYVFACVRSFIWARKQKSKGAT
jgi:hypothetical protein